MVLHAGKIAKEMGRCFAIGKLHVEYIVLRA